MTATRSRPAPDPKRCTHASCESLLIARDDPDFLEHLACKVCGGQYMVWVYLLRSGRAVCGYNFKPVVL